MLQIAREQLLRAAAAALRQGNWAEAERWYRQMVAQEPGDDRAWLELGMLASRTGQGPEAVEAFGRAAAIRPGEWAYQNNLGLALHASGRYAEAMEAFGAALQQGPNVAAIHYHLGNSLLAERRYAEAMASFQTALELDSLLAAAQHHIGVALHAQGRFEEAMECFRKAIALEPGNAEAQYNLGNALLGQEKTAEAIACFEQAIAINANYADAYDSLGAALKDWGRLEESIACRRRAMAIARQNAGFHSSLIVALLYHSESTGPSILEECRRWNRQHAEPLKRFIVPHGNLRDPERRLRIGYVSADFRQHPVALNMLPLLAAHGHDEFEIFGYSVSQFSDEITAKCRGHCDEWREAGGQSNQQIAELVRRDEIDILVDLGLHSGWCNLPIFARKPAPIQVTFAGYPGTTGMDAMDYRLTDPYLDPQGGGLGGDGQASYSEESIRLPESFWCYDPMAGEMKIEALPAHAGGERCVTFGFLGNFCKVNDEVLRLWGQVLAAVGNSHLLLLAPEGGPRRHVLEVLGAAGIASERVQFENRTARQKYLNLFGRLDVGLDTLPYNGHTTSLDSYWMGVPVVTQVGPTVVGRAGLSQLTNLGLRELVADSPEAFVRIAVELAGDLPRLAALRGGLRERMRNSPLMDGPGFAGNIEAAYRGMWRRWVRLVRDFRWVFRIRHLWMNSVLHGTRRPDFRQM